MPLEELDTPNVDPASLKKQDSVNIDAHKFLILKALQKNRCQLSISVKDIDETFVSMMLDVDVKNEWLELDELADGTAHLNLLKKKHYRASGWLNGVNIDFAARVTSHHQNKGLVRYRSTLPDTIYQNQRRASYRTPVGMMSTPEVHLILSDNQVIKGQISDISSNGALLSVPTGSPIGPGDRIAQCIFKTLDNKMIIVEADVRRQINTEHNSRTKLGCRFINLDSSTTQQIQHYTAAVERLNARRR